MSSLLMGDYPYAKIFHLFQVSESQHHTMLLEKKKKKGKKFKYRAHDFLTLLMRKLRP